MNNEDWTKTLKSMNNLPASSENQRWDPAQYAENARFVPHLGLPVVELLAPRPGERILDLGCGDGELTARLAAAGCQVVGVDASAEMVAATCARGLDARKMDGHALAFEAEFDAVFSNAALHWMNDPARVVEGVWRALKPGGRFVGEFGGQGNVRAIQSALEAALAKMGLSAPRPWYFPSPTQYRQVLEAAGFKVRRIELIPRPTPLPGDMSRWLETFAQPFTAVLPFEQRPAFITEVVEALRPLLCNQNGQWTADYVRLRFAAERPLS